MIFHCGQITDTHELVTHQLMVHSRQKHVDTGMPLLPTKRCLNFVMVVVLSDRRRGDTHRRFGFPQMRSFQQRR
jgi:hypothetical protein